IDCLDGTDERPAVILGTEDAYRIDGIAVEDADIDAPGKRSGRVIDDDLRMVIVRPELDRLVPCLAAVLGAVEVEGSPALAARAVDRGPEVAEVGRSRRAERRDRIRAAELDLLGEGGIRPCVAAVARGIGLAHELAVPFGHGDS